MMSKLSEKINSSTPIRVQLLKYIYLYIKIEILKI